MGRRCHVRNQNVKSPILVLNVLNERIPCRFFTNITDQPVSLVLRESGDRFLDILFLARADNDLRAFLRHSLSDGKANALGRSGDETNFVLVSLHL